MPTIATEAELAVPCRAGRALARKLWRGQGNFSLAFLIHEPDVIDAPMLENLLLITVPRAGMAATRAKAMADAISAYSIAVQPASSAI